MLTPDQLDAAYYKAMEIRKARHRARLEACIWASCIVLAIIAAAFVPHCTERAHADEGLAARALSWRPLFTGDRQLVRDLAAWVHDDCALMTHPIGGIDACPSIMLALAFRESAWRPRAVGALGEVGLFQVHGIALRGMSREDAADPRTNTRLAAQWIDHAGRLCRLSRSDNLPERTLSAYAGLSCSRSRSAALVLRWAREIQQ